MATYTGDKRKRRLRSLTPRSRYEVKSRYCTFQRTPPPPQRRLSAFHMPPAPSTWPRVNIVCWQCWTTLL